MSIPRALYLNRQGRLHQVPIPEMSLLREGPPWSPVAPARHGPLLLHEGTDLVVPPGVVGHGQQVDIELVVRCVAQASSRQYRGSRCGAG